MWLILKLESGPESYKPDGTASNRPESACQTASAARAAVSARIIRGPSVTGSTAGCLRMRLRSAGANPPSGPVSTPQLWRGVAVRSASAIGGASPASSQNSRPRSGGQERKQHWQGLRFSQCRHREASGLLRGLDRIGVQPFEIDPPRNRALRDDRQQHRDAQFRRLLRQIIRWRFFDRARTQATGPAHCAEPRSGVRRRATAFRRVTSAIRARHSPSLPLNSSTASPLVRAHDMKQIMRLRFTRVESCAPPWSTELGEQAQFSAGITSTRRFCPTLCAARISVLPCQDL